jgi:integrase
MPLNSASQPSPHSAATPKQHQKGEQMLNKTSELNTNSATIADVVVWATDANLHRDTIYELRKIAARLGITEEDLSAIPADLFYFETSIAPTPYGSVSNASNIEAARKRGNSRLRSCLKKFGGSKPNLCSDVSESFLKLIEAVKDREGFSACGADLPTCQHLPIYTLRRLSRVPLANLDQAEVNQMVEGSTPETRRSLVKGIKALNMLRDGQSKWPEIGCLLPPTELQVPSGRERAYRLKWSEFTPEFRENVDALFAETLVNPESLAQRAKQMMTDGVSSEAINKFVTDRTMGRKHISKNHEAAKATYRAAITWVARAYATLHPLTELVDPQQLFDRDIIRRAIDDQITRSNTSLKLKDANKSCTLANRLVSLKTLALYGLRSEAVVLDIEVLSAAYKDYIIKQREMTDNADAICTALQHNPHLASRFVNAPTALTHLAGEVLRAAQETNNKLHELNALRLYAVAALYAIQLSRPLRTRNLITLRHRLSPHLGKNLRWLKDGEHAEIRFNSLETKNERTIRVAVVGKDAQILWNWQNIYRPRLIELSGCNDSPYLFPGAATPRLVKNGLTLPDGTMSPASFAELWAKGDQVIGLGLTPHSCRHAIATLVLAKEPGNFAKAAAVLADSEATVRKHYGKDSGESASSAVRSVLLAQYPSLFKNTGGQY